MVMVQDTQLDNRKLKICHNCFKWSEIFILDALDGNWIGNCPYEEDNYLNRKT